MKNKKKQKREEQNNYLCAFTRMMTDKYLRIE